MKKAADKRDNSVHVRLTPQEHKHLEIEAKNRGLSISALLRSCALQAVKAPKAA